MDDLEEAVDLLMRKRGEHEAQIGRIDSALAALGRFVSVPAATGGDGAPTTAREKAVMLLDAQAREWSIAEIVAEWEKRGDPIRGGDPKGAVRAALKLAVKKNQVYKSKPGRYRSMKYAPTTTTLVFESPVAAAPHRNGSTEEMSGQEAAS